MEIEMLTPMRTLIAPTHGSRRIRMIVQATARVADDDERIMLARTRVLLVRLVTEWSRKLFARFMAAMHESRQREAARLLHRYRDLID